MDVPFHIPTLTGMEMVHIQDAVGRNYLSGDRPYSLKASSLLEDMTGSSKVFLVPSCTAALEMCALLLDIQSGDEVIMPSYTFVSTANAFALRGAVPVFIDVCKKSYNIDVRLLEGAISQKTKAIVAVHYAGASCDIEALLSIAKKYRIPIVEDAAQSIGSYYCGRHLGTFGALGALSFHETKNISCGEGGALLINDIGLIGKAEVLRDKGTNRSSFYRGAIDKYSWVSLGSSYLLGELPAAYLCGQLEMVNALTEMRLKNWMKYHMAFEDLEKTGRLARPHPRRDCRHNGHIYYLVLKDHEDRQEFISYMGDNGVECLFHYVPLHDSALGQKIGSVRSCMINTKRAADCLVRLPIGCNFNIEYVIRRAREYLEVERT